MSDSALRGLMDSAMEGLGLPRGAKVKARSQGKKAEKLGLMNVGLHSEPEEIAEFEAKLWHDQDEVVEERAREWVQHIYYDANYQYITYHRDLRKWIPRRTVPWRIRALYNVTHKAVNWRVSRLTENKPQVQVQARSEDREDVERAEYKDMLFWYLWDALKMHTKIRKARRWAALCCSGFLKVGWDPSAGESVPATKFFEEEVEVPVEQDDELAAELLGETTESVTVAVEYYVDEDGEKLGPVYEVVDPDADEDENEADRFMRRERTADENALRPRRTRLDPPEGTATIADGEVFVDVLSPFNIRWERYVDDPSDSWYVQHAQILPLSRIMSHWPGHHEKLKKAQPADHEDKALQWEGVVERRYQFEFEGTAHGRKHLREHGEDPVGFVDREYMVRETWVWPKTEHLKRLWGTDGRVLVTVGGVLIDHYPLPRWALEECNFIILPEDEEPGNHYRRTFLRDVIPLQDDINRTRSHIAEGVMTGARPIYGTLQGHQINLKLMGHMPGVLMTYRSPQHEPKPLAFRPQLADAQDFLESSLAAAQDLANMNEASTGQLPSAGLAAKAIYALQYADERSITEVSNAQDDALQRLAAALDAVTRWEYQEARKVRVVGENRFYLAEAEIRPEHLQAKVDYRFVPGSMLERQKEAVKNEIMQWLEAGLIDPARAARLLPTAVPGGLRRSHDLHEAKARRQVQRIIEGRGSEVTPEPWDRPDVHVMVLEETMLAANFHHYSEEVQARIVQLWQAYRTEMQPPPQAAQGGGGPAPGAQAQGGGQPPIGAAEQDFPTPEAVATLEQNAEDQMGPPPGFGEPPNSAEALAAAGAMR